MKQPVKIIFWFVLLVILIMTTGILVNWLGAGDSATITGTGKSDCPPDLTKYQVNGSSLQPMIKSGDTVVVDVNYYKCREVKRNDIIVYEHTGNDNPLIKIVKTVPGDEFHVQDDGTFYVNGQPLKNSQGKIYRFSKPDMLELYEDSMSGKLTDQVYFIFGDSPGHLSSEKFGPAVYKNIIGKVIRVE